MSMALNVFIFYVFLHSYYHLTNIPCITHKIIVFYYDYDMYLYIF